MEARLAVVSFLWRAPQVALLFAARQLCRGCGLRLHRCALRGKHCAGGVVTAVLACLVRCVACGVWGEQAVGSECGVHTMPVTESTCRGVMTWRRDRHALPDRHTAFTHMTNNTAAAALSSSNATVPVGFN